MSPVSKRRKCPNCIGLGYCNDGTECPTCEGLGEVDPGEDIVLPDEPCWTPA